MSNKRNNPAVENETAESSEYSVKRPRRSWLAAIICLILAVAVWTVVMYADDTAYVPLVISVDDNATWHCVLSDSTIEVKGNILSLKRATQVVVDLPDDITKPGTYVLTVENLIFPEGVAPAKVLELTVTVEEPAA